MRKSIGRIQSISNSFAPSNIKKTIFYTPIFSVAIFTNIYQKSFDYDDIVRLWIGPRLMVFLFHPDDVEVILSSQVYIDKSREYTVFKPWLGNGLLISTGQWKFYLFQKI